MRERVGGREAGAHPGALFRIEEASHFRKRDVRRVGDRVSVDSRGDGGERLRVHGMLVSNSPNLGFRREG
jgi:hypothetical protein